MSLIKDNKELDSTVAVFGVFLVFAGICSAIITLVFKSLTVPTQLIDIFQSVKELVLMILSYFFTKAVSAGSGDSGNTHNKMEDKH